MKAKKIKSAYALTFDDAISAAEYLVKIDDYPKKPCKVCKQTLLLLKELRKRLDNQAIGNNLVWKAFTGRRCIWVKD